MYVILGLAIAYVILAMGSDIIFNRSPIYKNIPEYLKALEDEGNNNSKDICEDYMWIYVKTHMCEHDRKNRTIYHIKYKDNIYDENNCCFHPHICVAL